MAGWVLLGALAASMGNSRHTIYREPYSLTVDASLVHSGDMLIANFDEKVNECDIQFQKLPSYAPGGNSFFGSLNQNSLIKIVTESSVDARNWKPIASMHNDNEYSREFYGNEYGEYNYADYYLVNIAGGKYFRIRVVKSIQSNALNIHVRCE